MEEIKNKIKQQLFFIKEYSSVIQLLFLFIQVIGYILFNSLYKIDSENYYNIPKKYFQIDLSFNVVALFFIFIMITFGIWIYAGLKKQEGMTWDYLIVVMIYCLVPTLLTYMYICKILNFDIQSKYIMKTLLSLSSIFYGSILVIIYIIHIINFKCFIFNKKIKEIKNKYKIAGIMFCTIISSLLIVYSIRYMIISENIKNKKKYEIYFENDKTKVIITKTGDKYIVADGKIVPNEVLEEMNDLEIDTRDYKEVSLDNVKRSYRTFRNVTVIKDEKLK